MRITALLLALSVMACDTAKDDDDDDDFGDDTGFSGVDLPGDDNPDDEDHDGDPVDDDECVDDSECGPGQICEEPDCVDGDRNNAADEAEPLAKDTEFSGYINPVGDHDFYVYNADGEEFIRVAINEHADVSEGSPVPDVHLTLYSPDGRVMTSADDYPNGGSVSNYDSVLYAYLQDAGAYVVEVQDANPMKENDPWGGAEYTYTLEISDWGQTTWGSDSTFAEPLAFGEEDALQIQDNTWHVIGVVLEEEGDVDYFAIDYPFDAGLIRVDGLQDLSGSNANPWAALYTADELAITARDEVGPNGTLYHPLLDANRYIVAVSDADNGGGDNHWFAILINGEVRSTDEDGNPINVEIEPNDSDVQAHAVSMTATENTSGKPFSYGFGVGFVDSPGDSDWYSIDVDGSDVDEAGYQWLVVCMNSTRWGSSIAPDITVYGSDGTTVLGGGTGELDADPNLAIENIRLTSPGETLYLHVDAGPDTAGTLDEWYIFKAYVTSFEVTGEYDCP